MTPAKEPKDRRQDKEARLRYAIRKANDRMFNHLEKRPEPSPRTASGTSASRYLPGTP